MNIEEIKLPWSDFQLVRRIGSGGYGEVYEAVRRISDTTEEHSAVKIITIPQNEAQLDQIRYQSGESFESTEAYIQDIVEDCKHEIEAMASLKYSPNICNLEDFRIVSEFNQEMNITQYQIFIREELLQPVHEYSDTGRLEEKDVVKMGLDICSALEVLETKNYVHRDVSPSNILISEHGNTVTFKLCDFGVARRLESLNSFLSRKGKSFYMPPELVSSKGTGTTTDIYGLGMTMYWYLNGNRFPFVPDTKIKLPSYYEKAEEIRVNNLQEIPAPVNASPDLAKIVLKAISFHPENRYQNASGFKHALLEYMNKPSEDIVVSGHDDIVVGADHSTPAVSDEISEPETETKIPLLEFFDAEEEETDAVFTESVLRVTLSCIPVIAMILIRAIHATIHIGLIPGAASTESLASILFVLFGCFISNFAAKNFRQSDRRKLPVILCIVLLGLIILSKHYDISSNSLFYNTISFQLPVFNNTITITPFAYAPILFPLLFAFYFQNSADYKNRMNYLLCGLISSAFFIIAVRTRLWIPCAIIFTAILTTVFASFELFDKALNYIWKHAFHIMLAMLAAAVFLRLRQSWYQTGTIFGPSRPMIFDLDLPYYRAVIILLAVIILMSCIYVRTVIRNFELSELNRFETIICCGSLYFIILQTVLILFETISYNPIGVFSPAVICYAIASGLIQAMLSEADKRIKKSGIR